MIINKMNADDIKTLMKAHVPALQDKELSHKKLSGLTNVTYAIYVDHEPLFIFKTFSDGFDRETENRIMKALV
jgi:thiamine kinase-like enzyme